VAKWPSAAESDGSAGLEGKRQKAASTAIVKAHRRSARKAEKSLSCKLTAIKCLALPATKLAKIRELAGAAMPKRKLKLTGDKASCGGCLSSARDRCEHATERNLKATMEESLTVLKAEELEGVKAAKRPSSRTLPANLIEIRGNAAFLPRHLDGTQMKKLSVVLC